MASEQALKRRRYDEPFKAEVMAECDAPGASVAKVAMAYGINANVVHRWRQLAREAAQASVSKPREFVPVVVASPAQTEAGGSRDIEIELRRGAITMKVSWPCSAAADLAAWTRELLR
jgi:transposase